MQFFGVSIEREGTGMPNQHVGFWEWILYMFLESISAITLPVQIIYAIASGKKNLKNYALASLIWTLIGVVLVIILAFVVFAIAAVFEASGGDAIYAFRF